MLYPFMRFVLWSLYGFAAGLVATGLWVIAHECGHQAFSESKIINNTVGWVLHTSFVLARCSNIYIANHLIVSIFLVSGFPTTLGV